LFLFGVLGVMLVLNAYFSYRSTSQVIEGEKWVTHTYTVLSAIDALEYRLQQAEVSANDYIVARKPESFTAASDYLSQADAKIDVLSALTKDNPQQQIATADAKSKIQAFRQALLGEMQSSTGQSAASGSSREQLNEALATVGRLKDAEAELLRQRSSRRKRRNGRHVWS
jgi:CHASE3 domain sensor protein